MAVSSHAVANAFIDLANKNGEALTNMQLQKLVYIAHGYHLAIFDAPLYREDTRAWQWGPVIPNLYESLRRYGANQVTESIDTPSDEKIDPDSNYDQVIRAVWKAYGHLTAGRLSSITHRENTPWNQTWKNDQFGVIGQQMIADHYNHLLNVTTE